MTKRNIPEKIGWYISGFVDGEGSFNVSLRKKSDYRVGGNRFYLFNVSRSEKTILAIIKRHFGCGIIKRRKDGLHSYDVTNPKVIQEKVIPFLKNIIFCQLIRKKLNNDKGRTRKYTLENVLESSETIRQNPI